MALYRLRLTQKIFLLPALATLAFLVILGVQLLFARGNGRILEDIERGYLPALELSRDLLETMAHLQRTLQDAVATADEGVVAEADGLRDTFLGRLAQERGNPMVPPGDLTAIEGGLGEYYGVARDVSLRLIRKEGGESVQRALVRMTEDYSALKSRLEAFAGERKREMALASARARGSQTRSGAIVSGIIVACIVVLAGIFWFITRSISGPLNRTVGFIETVAAGDLRGTLPVQARDEIGTVVAAANSMVEQLRETVAKISAAFGSLRTLSGELSGISGEISRGTQTQSRSVQSATGGVQEMNRLIQSAGEKVGTLAAGAERSSASAMEMAVSVDQVAGNAVAMAELTEHASAAITEMSASVREVAEHIGGLLARAEQSSVAASQIEAAVKEIERNVDQSLQLAETVNASVTGEAARSVRETVEGFARIRRMVTEATRSIEALGQRSQAIGNIVNVIDEISDRTNLLALNASILAAQAGKEGMGFAVVADEIRRLAESTAASTRDIERQVRGVQQDTAAAIAGMEASARVVEEGVHIVERLMKTLDEVASSAQQAAAASKVIARATSEQVGGTAQISGDAHQIAAMAREIAAATSEQSATSVKIVEMVASMRDQADQVRRSTVEQSRGAKDLAQNSQVSREMTQGILAAVREEAERGRVVVRSIEDVAVVARANTAVVERLNGLVADLGGHAEVLKDEIGRFSL